MTKFNPTATKALKIDYPLIFSLNTCNLSTIYHNILIIELKLRYLAATFYFVLKNFMTPIYFQIEEEKRKTVEAERKMVSY